jgi:hypothetical protein
VEDGEAVALSADPGRTAIRDGARSACSCSFSALCPSAIAVAFDGTCEQAGPARNRPVLWVEDVIGGAGAPPGWLAEGRHLEFGRLPADALTGVLDRALKGLPGLADDMLVGGDGSLGRHA